jgi:hypothetical protein
MLAGSGSNKGRRLIQPIWCGTGTITKSGQEPIRKIIFCPCALMLRCEFTFLGKPLFAQLGESFLLSLYGINQKTLRQSADACAPRVWLDRRPRLGLAVRR